MDLISPMSGLKDPYMEPNISGATVFSKYLFFNFDLAHFHIESFITCVKTFTA